MFHKLILWFYSCFHSCTTPIPIPQMLPDSHLQSPRCYHIPHLPPPIPQMLSDTSPPTTNPPDVTRYLTSNPPQFTCYQIPHLPLPIPHMLSDTSPPTSNPQGIIGYLTSHPIPQMLSDTLPTLPIRQLHLCLPQLLSNIFGYDNTPGWRLSSLHSKFHPTDFKAIRSFLKPNGGKEVTVIYWRFDCSFL